MDMNEIFKFYSGDEEPSGDFTCLFFERDGGEHTPYVGYYSEIGNRWATYEGDSFSPSQISAWIPLNDPALTKAIELVDAGSDGKAAEDEARRIALQAEPEYNTER